MKILLFVSILGLMACGSEKDEQPAVVQGVEVSALFCMDRCIALNESEDFSLADASNVCRGTFSTAKCCEYKDLPFYRECQ